MGTITVLRQYLYIYNMNFSDQFLQSCTVLCPMHMTPPNFYYVGDCGPHYFKECLAAFWIWRVFPTSLLVIGTFGNFLNVVILSQKQMRKYSTSTFLLALALTEIVVLWTSIAPDIVISITGSRIVDLSPVTCRLRWWLSLTSGSFSTWIVVLLTLERTLLTKAPTLSRTKLTPRNALIVCLIVLFLITALNSHMIFGLRHFDISDGGHLDTNMTSSIPHYKCLFSSPEYGKFYFEYWDTFILVFFNIIPACIIVVGNINIVTVLLLQRKRLAIVNPVTNSGDRVKRKSSAKLLLILSTFYILTTTPWCVWYIYRGDVSDYSAVDLARCQLLTAIVNTLVACNFSFNFFLYFVNGTLFKKEWRRLVNHFNKDFPTLWYTSTKKDRKTEAL